MTEALRKDIWFSRRKRKGKVIKLGLVEKKAVMRRAKANHKKPTSRILGKSEGIIERTFTRKMFRTLQISMKQVEVKTQMKRKVQNAFSAQKPS